ncbi:MAG: Crp/Fnr family transcriptional regulator [Clostridiales bacterium]|nr:Crp/Fnr family transcriptional regulator [Clostridiales bacterium]
MKIERLRRVPLLSGADAGLLTRCATENRIFSRKYAKGATVHRQHDPCATLDVVLSGTLVAYSLSENGSAVTMFEFRENGMIGANLLLGDSGIYPLNIYAVTPCELLHIAKSAVLELLRGYDFVLKYVKSLSLNSQGMNRKIALTQKTLRGNLLDYFRHQALAQGTPDMRLPISKKELADHMGVQRPSLFRELKRMKDEGLIDVSNRSVRILERGLSDGFAT